MDKMSKTVIGKDVIESLTLGMYDDSRFIYREYIQNAADQIDKARSQGLIKDGNIYIQINPEKETISIEDDATGIEEDKVAEILKNIAQSTKQRGVDKGFRGIGRLGGLGYCEQLIFETSFEGEDVKSIMIWDARKLKAIINDRHQKEEASAVIDAVTSLETKKEEVDKHYFKVTLTGVTKKELLDVGEIRTYLSMVAPVPFIRSFTFSGKIYKELKVEGIIIDEYNIFINTDQLFKGHNGYIYEGDKGKVGEIADVLFFKESDKKNNALFWGWYSITRKTAKEGDTSKNEVALQSLPISNFARGFRLRKSNIQIGNEDTLLHLHRDKRFQFYFFGEVHALHQELIPNARRDYFSETEAFQEFEEKLKRFFHTTIHNLCYRASEVNSVVRTINSYRDAIEQFNKKKDDGVVDNSEHESLLKELEKKKDDAEKAEKKLESIKTKSEQDGVGIPIKKIIQRAASKHPLKVETDYNSGIEKGRPFFRTDKLSKLKKDQRKFLANIFSIIKDVLPQKEAELLISRIEEEYR